ncbi:hypothetical protein TKK_0011312 [Trichogramma kaykai]
MFPYSDFVTEVAETIELSTSTQSYEDVLAQPQPSLVLPQIVAPIPTTAKNSARNICHQCGKSYVHLTTLKRHLRYECNKPPRFCCVYCPQRCKHKTDLKSHMLRCHKGQKLSFFICDDNEAIKTADRTYPTNQFYISSVSGSYDDTGEQGYRLVYSENNQCPQCGKMYAYPSTLKRHLRYECGKLPVFGCHWCVYRSKRLDSLKAHEAVCKMKKHHYPNANL